MAKAKDKEKWMKNIAEIKEAARRRNLYDRAIASQPVNDAELDKETDEVLDMKNQPKMTREERDKELQKVEEKLAAEGSLVDTTGPKEFGIASPKALESSPINISGKFTPKDKYGVEAGAQDPNKQDLYGQYADAVRIGDYDSAQQVLALMQQEQDLVSGFRKDLSPEALMADLMTGIDEKREGMAAPSMTLTKTGVFSGEKRAPYDIQKGEEKTAYQKLRDIQSDKFKEKENKRLNNNTFLAAKRLEADINKSVEELKNRRLQLETIQKKYGNDMYLELKTMGLNSISTQLEALDKLSTSPFLDEKKRKQVEEKYIKLFKKFEKISEQ